MSIREKRDSFMKGRNGFDKLSVFTGTLASALTLLSVILTAASLHAALYSWSWTLLFTALTVFRVLSRNIYARRRENSVFMGLSKLAASRLRLAGRMIKDRKTHVYKKCPCCRARLRFPREPGKHTAVCPICENRFDINIK